MANEGIVYEIYPYDDPTRAVAKWIIPGRAEPKFLEQMKANGGGSFKMPKLDPKYRKDPTMLDSRNLVKVKIDNKLVGAFLLGQSEGTIVNSSERKEQGYLSSGEGLKSWFDDAEVFAHNGLPVEAGKGRYFNFSSPERGSWYDANQWQDPKFYGEMRQPGHAWSGEYPEKWPEALPPAKWFGAYNYNANQMPYDPYYVRWELTIAQPGVYAIYISADDQFILYVDGEQVAKSDVKTTAWIEGNRVEVNLSAGVHAIGVVVQNRNAEGYNGPTALLMGLTSVGFDGAETKVAVTNGTDGVLKVVPGPVPVPGWTVGDMLLKLLAEAKARSIRFPNYLIPTFTATQDSYGNAWASKHEWSFSIGESYASVLKTIETMYDVWITPDFKLHMAPTRAVDRSVIGVDANGNTTSGAIRFEFGKHILDAGDTTRGKIKNFLALKTTEGWTYRFDQASIDKYGRIEGSLETKTTGSLSYQLADIIFAQRAEEEEGATYQLLLGKWIPWVHFFPGDWVLAPNRRGEYVRRRVMSISVEEHINGQPKYSIEFDTIFNDNEDRISAVVDKLGGGGVGGSAGGSAIGITPGGAPGTTLPPGSGTTSPTPKRILDLAVTSTGYWPADGITPRSEVRLVWSPVTQSTNDQAMVVARYEVEADNTTTTEEGWIPLGFFTATDVKIREITPGVPWKYRVRAVSRDEKYGLWSDEKTHSGANPTAPMLAPSKPLLTSEKGLLAVRWDGNLSDGNPAPPQFRYCYAEFKASSSSVWVQAGPVVQRGGGQTIITGGVVGTSYDVRLIAIDGVRIPSPPSASATITLAGVDLGSLNSDVKGAIDAANAAASDAQANALTAKDIANQANMGMIGPDRIGSNSVGLQKLLLTSFENLVQDPGFEFNTTQAWTLASADVTNVTANFRSGARALAIATRASTAYLAAIQTAPMSVSEGERYRVGAWIKMAGGAVSGDGLVMRMQYASTATGNYTSSDNLFITPVDLAGTYTYVGGEFMVPTGARFIKLSFMSRDGVAGKTYYVDDVEMFKMVQGELIVDGTIKGIKIAADEITAIHLAANSVTAEQIQANSIVSDKIAANQITGKHLAFQTIEGDSIKAGTIQVNHVSPTFGNDIIISGNLSIISAVGKASAAQTSADAVAGNVAAMQTYYTFGPDGAIISNPSSVLATAIRSDRIEMLENGNVISYWNSGTLYVNQLQASRVTLASHQLEAFGADGTVVRSIG